MGTGTVLYVDSDVDSRAETESALAAAGFDVIAVGDVSAGEDVLETTAVDAVVTDHALPDDTGLDLIATARRHSPDAVCVLYTDVDLGRIDTASIGGAIVEYVPRGDAGATEELIELLSFSVTANTQTSYPLPSDEPDRLAALRKYTADPVAIREDLDRLTRLAAVALEFPMAAIGFIEKHEEEFMACYGTSLDPIPREETVCTYAMLDEDVTVIEDVTTDPRFEKNETLLDAGIRAYASANITDDDGHVIGTFCLYDTEPRTLDARQREMLQLFAADAWTHLDLRADPDDTGSTGRRADEAHAGGRSDG